MVFNPIRRPIGMLRQHILSITPIGMHIEDVISKLENEISHDSFRVNLNRGFTTRITMFEEDTVWVGEMSIRAYLGSYMAWYKWFPLMDWGVIAFFGFDENGQLIDIYVEKIGMS